MPVISKLFARWTLAILLAVCLLITIGLLLNYLNAESPNAALTALLGTVAAFLGQSLVAMAQSIANGKEDI